VTHQHYPAVVFEVDSERVTTRRHIAFIRVPFNAAYASIEFKRFVNVP
jgi:hypothetical protein